MLAIDKSGFTLIELVIGLAVFALLLSVAMPAFTAYMQNTRLLALAESFNSGLQLARAEAVRRNTQVDFVVLADPNRATAASKDVASGSTAGKSWMVRALDPSTGAFDFVDGKDVQEGASQTIAVTSGSAIVRFNNLGGTNLAGAIQYQFSSAAGLACAPTGPIRCMNVRLSAGGQARLCDPLVTAASDTRAC